MALGIALLSGGCALAPQEDPFPPMPAATAEADNPSLANDVNEPEPLPVRHDDRQPHQSDGLWSVIRAGYRLPEPDNRRVRVERDWFADHPSYLARATARADRYLYFIVQEARKRHMPLELTLLPVVESAFDPFAYSHGQAAGPWQFIPSTGKYFGLQQNWWYDGRRDIVRSTRAALDYLQKLAQRFDGDWLLALAAYNAGGGTVSRAQRANAKRGKPTDFWHLDLPDETTAYVPKLLAVAEIVKDPQRYGVTLHPIADQPYFKIVDVGSQIDLAQAAKLAGISMRELYLLNPAYNRWATAPHGPHTLLVPADDALRFKEGLAALPVDQRVRWRRYQIQRGDSLIAIARDYHTTPAVLRSINHISSNRIIAGHTLLIPSPAASNNELAVASSSTNRRQRVNYQVSSGDTLWSIAHQHQVTVSALAKWNHMSPKQTLKIGQTLAIWRDTTAPASSQASARKMIRKVHYSVRRGDSLYAIADRFNVSVGQIRDWNDSIDDNQYLQPGDALTLYVDIRKAP